LAGQEELWIIQRTIHNHLAKMAALPKLLNTDSSQDFTVLQVAQKHGWTLTFAPIADRF